MTPWSFTLMTDDNMVSCHNRASLNSVQCQGGIKDNSHHRVKSHPHGTIQHSTIKKDRLAWADEVEATTIPLDSEHTSEPPLLVRDARRHLDYEHTSEPPLLVRDTRRQHDITKAQHIRNHIHSDPC